MQLIFEQQLEVEILQEGVWSIASNWNHKIKCYLLDNVVKLIVPFYYIRYMQTHT